MRLVLIPESRVDTAVHQLPEPDMVVDPRPNLLYEVDEYKFKVTVNRTTLTITRTDPPENRKGWDVETGWNDEIFFRVYNSNEQRYSFNSRKYIYHGVEDEQAPRDATEVIIKDGAETIGRGAFGGCRSLVKVTIPKSVKRIEDYAFSGCESLRFIQLPPNLQYIGEGAFSDCTSLEAVFLPPTVTQIDRVEAYTFEGCTSLRILNIPDSVQHIGFDVIIGCESLLTDEMEDATDEEEIEWLRNRYNPFHNLCCQPSPSPQAIKQYIQDHDDNEVSRARTNDKHEFTALHLLAANPSVTGDMITAYLQLAPDVATMHDNIGMTPLHMLCSLPQFSYGTGSAIRAPFDCNEGKEAAFMTDSQGKTPFQYLCEKSFDDMPFLKNKSFGGLLCWWFDGLEMNLFTEGVGEINENTKIRKRKFSGGSEVS